MKRLPLNCLLPGLCLAIASAGLLTASGYERLTTRGNVSSARPATLLSGEKRVPADGRRLERLKAGTRRTSAIAPKSGLKNLKSPNQVQKRLLTADPRGTLLGGVVSYQGIQSASDGYWGSVDVATGNVTPLFTGRQLGAGQDYDIQTGAVRDGILYTPVALDDYFGVSIEWQRTDLATGQQLPSIAFGEDWAAFAYSMTYDPDADLFHILGLDLASQSFGIYSTVDPETWNVETYGMLSTREYFGAIAYNPADRLVWTFSDANQAYTIDEGSLIEMGSFDSDYELIRNVMTTAATYSPLDGSFVFLWLDYASKTTRLAYLDPETLEIYDGPSLSPDNPYFGYLYSPDQYAANEAPALPGAPKADFADDALTGTISFQAPTETYAAQPLSGTVKMTLMVDGKKECETELAPGAVHSLELTLAQGLHKLELQGVANGEMSPMATSFIFTGNDNPRMPEDLKLDGTLLSWSPVGGKGAHGGFVAENEITYNVYVDGTLQNPVPLTACSWQLDTDRPLGLSDIEVTATARDMESEKAGIAEIIGNGLSLPWEMMPSDEEVGMFRMVNANNDDSAFEFGYDDNREHNIFELWLESGAEADDWVFLPKTLFPSAENLYDVAFSYRNSTQYESFEDIDVMIGTAPDPAAMTRNIYSHRDRRVTQDELITIPFAVEAPGEYVVGIHCVSRADRGWGIHLFNFAMQAAATSSAVPGDPSKVEITPASLGALSATVEITAPTADMAGNPLPADEEVSFKVECVDGGSAVIKALPGAKASGEVTVGGNGTAFFRITPFNSLGEGAVRQHSAYVGIDRPRAPREVIGQASEDNRSMTISWSQPEALGENGGYVDRSALTYVIYTLNGATTNEVATVPANVSTYTFTPAERQQFTLNLGVAARNTVGESRFNTFISENIGTPYPVPVTEEFSSNGFTLDPIMSDQSGPYSNSAWESVGSVLGMGTGVSTDFKLGGLIVYNQVPAPGHARMKLPKMTTVDSKALAVMLRWLDWRSTPVFSVWGRVAGEREYEKLGEFTPERPAAGQWRESQIELPERFNDASWVEFCVNAELTGEIEEFGFIDAFSVMQNVEYDFKIASIAAPASMTVGEKSQVLVTVLNAGQEPQRGTLKVEVSDVDGKIWHSQSWNIPRMSAEQNFMQYVDVEAYREFLEGEMMIVNATVEAAEQDEIRANDSLVAAIDIKPSQAPSIGTLQAAWADDSEQSARLSWQAPDLSYGDSDGFEMLPAFTVSEQLGFWVNLDRDGGYPFRVNGLEWAHNNEPIAWQPFDARALGVNEDERLGAHSGGMYLMARSISYDDTTEEEPQQSDDWLISPEIVGGTQLEFWYGTIDPDLTEFVKLMVSSTDRNPESFRYVRTFSKSGSESWENVRVMLPADARYFALVYASYDSFAAMIDDISFTPVQLQQWEVDHYNVLRALEDGQETGIGTTEATEYVDDTLEGRTATYRVVTAVKTVDGFREGPASNWASLAGSGIDDMRLLQGVSGGKGVIRFTGHEGARVALYGADGRYVAGATVAGGSWEYPMPAGIYMVKIGNAYAKVLVK